MTRPLAAAAALAALLLPASARADDDAGAVRPVIVTAPTEVDRLIEAPNTSATVTADQLRRTLSVITPEDALRYLPNLLVRQRHLGDTQSPVTTRTSGLGASARSLIFIDGVLISALIGNNNTTASPKWGLVAPDAIERVDVLYGPFSAAFAGNSIGGVIRFTTRMPKALEAHVQVQGALQSFSKYADDRDFGTGRISADLGDAFGPLSFRVGYSHLDSRSQPLSYVTLAAPGALSTAGAPVTGAVFDANRLGAPIVVAGAGGLEHQRQDNISGRVAYELTPSLTAAYSFGLFHNDDDATAETYLRDAQGQPVYAAQVNIAGHAYTLAPASFSSQVYALDEWQLAQGLTLGSHTGGAFDFTLTASAFDNLRSRQRVPALALPGGFAGGAGSDTRQDGTRWRTFDGEGRWRAAAGHVISFGAHLDRFRLKSPKYALSDWRGGPDGALQSLNAGRTRTRALWAQDSWSLSPDLQLTTGVRYEQWRADGGLNYSAAPPLAAHQPKLRRNAVSPKAVLAWSPSADWTLKASVGAASRFPTVGELYQAVTTAGVLSVPDPNLKPERAISRELSAERRWTGGSLRVSLFDEHIRDALISQTGTLRGSTVSFVQNVERTRAAGVEVVADQRDVAMPGLELSGWVTWLDTEIQRDRAYAPAVGKRLPQLPRWRAAAVATYSGIPKLDLTLAARYASRAFGTIDNSDPYANTYQGFSGFLVVDAHARYRIDRHLSAGLGVTNLNDRSYFLFHPFPQRTVTAELTYAY